jgi:D-aminopeptidase
VDIVGQNLANKMDKGDPEYKVFKENYDRVINYFTENLNSFGEELIFEIFYEINDRQDEFVNVLSRNMLDFCDMVRFFSKCLKVINPLLTVGQASDEEGVQNLNKGKTIFSIMIEALSQISIKLLNNDP